MGEYLAVEITSAKCGTKPEEITVERIGGIIYIRGSINVSNPCHTIKLREEIDKENKILRLILDVKRTKKICIQCLASLDFVIKINRYHYRMLFDAQSCKLRLEYHYKGKVGVLYDGDFEL